MVGENENARHPPNATLVAAGEACVGRSALGRSSRKT